MEPIKKNNLVDEVYKQLLQMLSSGEYPEGSRIPSESQLSEILCVSRNTVRTAISKLIAIGIIENHQGYGNCVRSVNVGTFTNSILPCMVMHGNDLETITEYRIGVESMAARLAAERATSKDTESLYELCELAAQHIEDRELFAKYDMAFHRRVAEITENPLFITTLEMIESMYTKWLIGLQGTHGVDKSHDFHFRIYQAIQDHNAKEAGLIMQQHLEDVLTKIRLDESRKNQILETKN